jgi:arylsulfatase A-like enzyme
MSALTRRSFLAAGTPAIVVKGQQPKRPNILWVSCEDTGPQIGCYGDPYAVTPTIDRLAAQGVRYRNAHTVAGVCAPSRSGIITGMYPSTIGSQYMRCKAELPDYVRCFPEYLREAGYYCTNNSKTDYNFDFRKESWDESSNKAHWKNRRKDQPFFAVFNFVVTHEGQVRQRGPAHEKNVARLTASQRRDPAKAKLPPYYPDTPEARRDWANYYELITAMDYMVQDRLKELEDAGLLEDTIVFFWGDHGVGLPRAKRWIYEASTLVPLVVRIPEKFRTAGQGKPGSWDNQLVSFIDLGPTLLNLAGVPVPKHMHGRPFLGPKLGPPRQYIHAIRDRMDERYDCIRAVRDSRYRYIRNYMPHKPWAQHISYMEQGFIMKDLRRLHAEGKLNAAQSLFMAPRKPVEELYDCQNDPHNINNLADSPQHQDILKRLRAEHERWAIETRDLGLIPEAIVQELGQKLGSRKAILERPGSEAYIRQLRQTVEAANRQSDLALLRKALDDKDAAIRYWGLVGLTQDRERAASIRAQIQKAMNDPSAIVRITAAHAAAHYFDDTQAITLLAKETTDHHEAVALSAIIALDELGAKAKPVAEAIRNAANRKDSGYIPRVAEHALSNIS